TDRSGTARRFERRSWTIRPHTLFGTVALLAGCFQANSEDCGNGTICPPGLSCQKGGGCFDPLQCSSGDGQQCGAHGTCEGGDCVASVCGDGVVERGETCDDGNALSHDGCSSRCE